MRTVASAMEARATDVNAYNAAGAALEWPNADKDISDMDGMLTPTYIKKIPHYDGWNTLLKFGVTTEGDSYSIKSWGADKKENSTATTASAPVTTANFDCDIIFSEGNFVMYPEGVQTQ
ncbi:MAG: hypothetical protein M3Q69_09550 [Acidobacteriota bacterium]|nr:hypothetical protein [Acidobacteriota bacterium]